MVSLLLAFKNFYDLCTFEHLVKQGMDYKYPPLILQMALEVYRGDRYLVAEGMVSNKIVPTKGVLAGCPFGPAKAKLDVMSQIQHLAFV